MSGIEYRLDYVLGKTKSGSNWHIVKVGRISWCNREVVGEVRPNVSFDDFRDYMRRKEFCHNCLGNLMTDDANKMIRFPGVAAAERMR